MGMSSFGFGQRACLGQSLTRDELLIACGSLLWAFNLIKKTNPKTGQLISPSLTASNSLLIVKPDAFEMAFEPRSEKKVAEIKANWKEAQEADVAERATFAKGAAVTA